MTCLSDRPSRRYGSSLRTTTSSSIVNVVHLIASYRSYSSSALNTPSAGSL